MDVSDETKQDMIDGLITRMERTVVALEQLKNMPTSMFDVGCQAIIVDIKDTLYRVKNNKPYL